MRQTLSWTEVTGFHEGPVGSYWIKSSHNFDTIGVAALDQVRNNTTGVSGHVYTTNGWILFDYLDGYGSTVPHGNIDDWDGLWDVLGYIGSYCLMTDVYFNPGDFFTITLGTAWTVANEFGPIYEYVCRQCGLSCERWKMIDGKCSECQDKSFSSMN